MNAKNNQSLHILIVWCKITLLLTKLTICVTDIV